MPFDSRIGIAGLIVGVLGIGITILWPTKKVGWTCIGIGILFAIGWAYTELRPTEPKAQTETSQNKPKGNPVPSPTTAVSTVPTRTTLSLSSPQDVAMPEVVLVAPDLSLQFAWVPGMDSTPRVSPVGKNGYPTLELRSLSDQPVVGGRISWTAGGPTIQELIQTDRLKPYGPTMSGGMFGFRSGSSFLVGESATSIVPFVLGEPILVDIPLEIWNKFTLVLIATAERAPTPSAETPGIMRRTEKVADALLEYRQGQKTYTRHFRVDSLVSSVADEALIGGSFMQQIPQSLWHKDNLRAILRLSVSETKAPQPHSVSARSR